MSTPRLDPQAVERAVREHWDGLVALRREFHTHPELSFQEHLTAGRIVALLTELGLEVRTGIGKTGVSALLRGDRPGKRLLIRADIDALPIQEVSAVPYASTNPGVMHA